MTDDYCIGCRYFNNTGEKYMSCDYLYKKGERRGCPAGWGCGKKDIEGKKQRFAPLILPGSRDARKNFVNRDGSNSGIYNNQQHG